MIPWNLRGDISVTYRIIQPEKHPSPPQKTSENSSTLEHRDLRHQGSIQGAGLSPGLDKFSIDTKITLEILFQLG